MHVAKLCRPPKDSGLKARNWIGHISTAASASATLTTHLFDFLASFYPLIKLHQHLQCVCIGEFLALEPGIRGKRSGPKKFIHLREGSEQESGLDCSSP